MIVRLSEEALEEVMQLPKAIRVRMLNVVDRLVEWPAVSGAKPLRGKLAGHYRIRTGDYRLQFRVSEETVFVEKIGHRDGFYED